MMGDERTYEPGDPGALWPRTREAANAATIGAFYRALGVACRAAELEMDAATDDADAEGETTRGAVGAILLDHLRARLQTCHAVVDALTSLAAVSPEAADDFAVHLWAGIPGGFARSPALTEAEEWGRKTALARLDDKTAEIEAWA